MYLSRPSSISNSCDKDERNVAVTDYRRLMPKTEQKTKTSNRLAASSITNNMRATW
jgi:hypothetical protein